MLRALLDFLLPPECRLCGSPLPAGREALCPLCSAALPRTGYHLVADNPMAMRFAGRFPFGTACGHFFYAPDAPVSQLIQDFKYRGAPVVARELGRLMAEELMMSGMFDGVDWLMPVPLHWTKLMRRGYNQSEELAKGISEVSGVAVSRDLRAWRSHRSQTRVSRAQRLLNAEGIFTLKSPEAYEGKRVILIDDVCTTGSTLSSAAETVLAAAPGAHVSLLTLAVTV